MTMNAKVSRTEARRIIRAEAQRMGQTYRITKDDEVHFYGPMPNSTETGWWLFAATLDEAIKQILPNNH